MYYPIKETWMTQGTPSNTPPCVHYLQEFQPISVWRARYSWAPLNPADPQNPRRPRRRVSGAVATIRQGNVHPLANLVDPVDDAFASKQCQWGSKWSSKWSSTLIIGFPKVFLKMSNCPIPHPRSLKARHVVTLCKMATGCHWMPWMTPTPSPQCNINRSALPAATAARAMVRPALDVSTGEWSMSWGGKGIIAGAEMVVMIAATINGLV